MTKDQRNRSLFISFFIIFEDVQEMLMELALQGDREFLWVNVHVFAEGDIVKTLVTVFHHRYHGKVVPAVLLVVSNPSSPNAAKYVCRSLLISGTKASN